MVRDTLRKINEQWGGITPAQIQRGCQRKNALSGRQGYSGYDFARDRRRYGRIPLRARSTKNLAELPCADEGGSSHQYAIGEREETFASQNRSRNERFPRRWVVGATNERPPLAQSNHQSRTVLLLSNLTLTLIVIVSGQWVKDSAILFVSVNKSLCPRG